MRETEKTISYTLYVRIYMIKTLLWIFFDDLYVFHNICYNSDINITICHTLPCMNMTPACVFTNNIRNTTTVHIYVYIYIYKQRIYVKRPKY